MDLLRDLGPVALTVVTILLIEGAMERRGQVPPRLRTPPELPVALVVWLRRGLAALALGLVFFLGIFSGLATLGTGADPDPEQLEIGQLFSFHLLLGVVLLAWYALGFLPQRAGESTSLAAQYGLRARSLGTELGLGAVAGIGIWLSVLVILLLLSALVALLGGEEALPDRPPPLVLWVSGLPVWARVAVAGSAGLFEEAFFRGLLQPRVGVGLSTALFTLAHLNYEQPLMLVGVAILSLCFAALVRWRQSVFAAMSAHAVFDLVQLLFVIPVLSRFMEPEAAGVVASIC